MILYVSLDAAIAAVVGMKEKHFDWMVKWKAKVKTFRNVSDQFFRNLPQLTNATCAERRRVDDLLRGLLV